MNADYLDEKILYSITFYYLHYGKEKISAFGN